MWLKIRQFAEKHGVSTSAVQQRIKKGTLQSRKNKGVWEVFDEDETTPVPAEQKVEDNEGEEISYAYTLASTKKTELQNKLKEQKLKNLQQDTILKRIKNEETVEKIRREFAELVFEAFTESFDDVKTLFISLKLDKENNQKLKQVFSKAIKKFQNNLLKKLEEGDKKDEN